MIGGARDNNERVDGQPLRIFEHLETTSRVSAGLLSLSRARGVSPQAALDQTVCTLARLSPGIPTAVATLKDAIASADGLLIVTPNLRAESSL